MKNKLILLFTLLLSSLACSSQTAIPHRAGNMSDNGILYLPPPSQEMSVTADRLYIRTSAGGEVSTVNGRQAYLIAGDIVTVTEVVVIGDTQWCRIGADRWVACRWLEAK